MLFDLLIAFAFLIQRSALASPPEALDHQQNSPCNTLNFSAPAYRISSFRYVRSYDDIDSQLLGYPEFVVTDVVNNSTTGCDMRRHFTENTPNDYRTCFRHGENAKDYPSMEFNYLFSTGQLSIRQSWACDHPDHSFDTMWQANGTVTFTATPTCGANVSKTEPYTSIRNRTLYNINCTMSDEYIPNIVSNLTKLGYASNRNSAAAGMATKQQATPLDDVPCLGRSFTYPNWRIFNLTGVGNATAGTFALQNRATRRTVVCPSGQAGWASCAATGSTSSGDSTYIKYEADISSFSVNQTWACEATAGTQRTQFRAIGNAKLHSECLGASSGEVKWRNSTKCLPGDAIIKGTLVKPVNLRPKGPSIPGFVNSPGCRASSEHPAWDLSGLDFRQIIWNENKWGTLKFALGNGANGFTTPIEITHYDLNVYTDSPRNRSWHFISEPEQGFAGNEVETTINFDPTTDTVTISQSWTCYEENRWQDNGIRFEATGKAEIPFQCNWTNATYTFHPWFGSSNGPDPGPYPPSISLQPFTAIYYDAKCSVASNSSVAVTGSVVSKTELDPMDVLEMAPSGRSCTLVSVAAPHWTFADITTQSWWLTTNMVSKRNGGGYIDLRNSALGQEHYYRVDDENTMSPGSGSFNPDAWYTFRDNVTGSIQMQFQIDLGSGYFAINESWFCDDKDPDHPILFSASGSAKVGTNCYIWPALNDTWAHDEWVRCDGPGSDVAIIPSSISWKTLPTPIL